MSGKTWNFAMTSNWWVQESQSGGERIFREFSGGDGGWKLAKSGGVTFPDETELQRPSPRRYWNRYKDKQDGDAEIYTTSVTPKFTDGVHKGGAFIMGLCNPVTELYASGKQNAYRVWLEVRRTSALLKGGGKAIKAIQGLANCLILVVFHIFRLDRGKLRRSVHS